MRTLVLGVEMWAAVSNIARYQLNFESQSTEFLFEHYGDSFHTSGTECPRVDVHQLFD